MPDVKLGTQDPIVQVADLHTSEYAFVVGWLADANQDHTVGQELECARAAASRRRASKGFVATAWPKGCRSVSTRSALGSPTGPTVPTFVPRAPGRRR